MTTAFASNVIGWAMTGIRQDTPGRGSSLWLAALVFGALMNPLMLIGPVFMLQVYDRVIPAQSTATLGVVFALAGFLYTIMALLDSARARVLARLAARLRARLERPLFEARLRALVRDPGHVLARGALQDLDAVHRAMASAAMLALLDAPWAFVFFTLLFFVHPSLGGVAFAGGLALVALALWGQWRIRPAQMTAQRATQGADTIIRVVESDADTVFALGMDGAAADRWQRHRGDALSALLRGQDRSAVDGAIARAFRMFMQSAILAVGALLVLRGDLSPALIVAASILMGRALAPVEVLATQWANLRAALHAWRRVQALLTSAPGVAPVATSSPLVRGLSGTLAVQGLVVTPCGGGAPILRIKGFEVPPGRALGVIGPSGSGKSTLARVLIGAVPLAAGTLRLGDTPLPMPPPVGHALGYLPQRITTPVGTITEVIARFATDCDPSPVQAAARAAGVHDLIITLPQGYATPVEEVHLSGGQMQRLGLARALFGDPTLVILDEPNAHLDAEGSAALNDAIRALKARGAVVLVMAHRPAAITECEDLLVLENGAQVAFGPRDRVLREMVRNHTTLVPRAPGAGT